MEGKLLPDTACGETFPDIFDRIAGGWVGFIRHVYGVVATPYQTMRRVVDRSQDWETFFVGIFLICYFAAVALVKVASFRPFLLTRHFLVLVGAAGTTFLFISGTIYTAARFFGGQGSFRRVYSGWIYTLVPTLLWFLVTSLASLFVPPPRTTSFWGVLFSILYLSISAILFYWKLMLSYLTVRFAMHLDLVRIAGVFSVTLPVIIIYSYAMYKLGIYRVPFI